MSAQPCQSYWRFNVPLHAPRRGGAGTPMCMSTLTRPSHTRRRQAMRPLTPMLLDFFHDYSIVFATLKRQIIDHEHRPLHAMPPRLVTPADYRRRPPPLRRHARTPLTRLPLMVLSSAQCCPSLLILCHAAMFVLFDVRDFTTVLTHRSREGKPPARQAPAGKIAHHRLFITPRHAARLTDATPRRQIARVISHAFLLPFTRPRLFTLCPLVRPGE